MAPNRNFLARIFALFVCAMLLTAARVQFAHAQDQALPQKFAPALDDRALGDALCSIVYQVDRFPSPRGYRYIFYGNGFFINRDGYVLTAAHVLSQLRGGQPAILLRSPGAPPRFVQASVVALDRDHDVALLVATPNPFAGNLAVSFLTLGHDSPKPGQKVLAADARPVRPRDAYTLDPAVEERSAGDVLDYEFSRLAKGPVDTELFLFGHAVQPGQSGAPVISLDSREVVGLVEGQWLRDSTTALAAPSDHPAPGGLAPIAPSQAAPIPGAVIPIHYAIALLQQKGIAWHDAAEESARSEQAGDATTPPAQPTPLSLVPAPYPQSLFGGEVVLDTFVSRTGTLSDIKVISGDEPFLDKALAAMRTWTFDSTPADTKTAYSRISVTFQFVQPYAPPRSPTVHEYDADSSASGHDVAARPVKTVEPKYPDTRGAEGSVILYESIDREGHVASVQVVSGPESLAASALSVAHEWRFAPGRQAGVAVDSAAIVVFGFRHPLATVPQR